MSRYVPIIRKRPGAMVQEPLASINKPKKKNPWVKKPGSADGQNGTGDAGVTAPPPDPMLQAQQAAANTRISLGDAWDTYKTGQVNLDYGNLDNPAGDLTSNPYSKAALLQKSYNDTKRGSLTSYAAQGQLYSGAYQNKTEADLEGYNRGLDSLKKSKQASLDDLLMGKLDRYSQVGAGVNQDTLNSILKALGA